MYFLTCAHQNFFTQLYHRRAKYTNRKEKALWSEIDAGFMSEESTHESDDGPVVHKKPPSFRSSSELVYLQSLLFYECVCVCVCT